jgi:hypothetical protein
MSYRSLLVSLPIALVGACSTMSPQNPSLGGRAEAVVTQIPGSVNCIQITAAGSSVVATNVDATPGKTLTVQLTQLPVGSVTFSALAFSATCAAVTSSSVADWASKAVVATVSAGQVTPVDLLLEPVGNASVGIGFDIDGGAPDLATGPCVPTNPNPCQSEGLVCGNAFNGCVTVSCGTCAAGLHCCGDTCSKLCL